MGLQVYELINIGLVSKYDIHSSSNKVTVIPNLFLFCFLNRKQ